MAWHSDKNPMFRTPLSEKIYYQKYSHDGQYTWAELARVLVDDVCADYISKEECDALFEAIRDLKFIPGGRYLYYAGRKKKYFNNCFLLRAEEDSREDWANLSWKAESCLMTGGGIGIDYSVYRASNTRLDSTGGVASGPIPKMQMINEIGRKVMQGGSRRSAIYASLNWQHGDIKEFIHVKDWHKMPVAGTNGLTLWDLKNADQNFPCPLDMTNISVNYDSAWLIDYWKTGTIHPTFMENVRQAMMTGEPGFSFNFFDKEKETLRNAPVAADTWVMTEEGYRQVKELVDLVASVWTGKQFAETVFKKTKEYVPTVVVEMTGGRHITCDPEHEFLVERYKGVGASRRLVSIDRVPASELNIGDTLHVSLPTFVCEADMNWYWRGYAYGDGSFDRVYGKADIAFCCEDKKILAGGLPVGTTVNKNDSRGYIRAYLKDEFYKNAFKEVFPTLHPRHIPDFLAGLFDADGSYDPNYNRVRLASVHYDFLEGVRRALETVGILSGINKGGSSGYGGRDSYLLVVYGSSVSVFADKIPTWRLKVASHNAYRKTAIKVLSVEDGPQQDVFCCDVGVPEHSFMAEGVIISNCTEVCSADDSDVCNLGSINLGRVDTIVEFQQLVELATLFLICGTFKADLPYEKVKKVREKNRRLGLGIMGVHEWLMKRGQRYECTEDLHRWLNVYEKHGDRSTTEASVRFSCSKPVASRAIAPTGTIGMVAGTTTGIEPLFAVAYKRRYLKGTKWHYQYVVDGAAQELIETYGFDPDKIESALDLAQDPKRRIAFQAHVQEYVDQSISSTINLPAWGSEHNNEDKVEEFAHTLAKYANRLRGFTAYPDCARGGQPLTVVPYSEAVAQLGQEFEEAIQTHDICEITSRGGTCGA